jgi:hypothetical protein
MWFCAGLVRSPIPDMSSTACPDRRILAAFSHGTLDAPQWDAVAEHVEDCSHCQEQLDEIDAAADGLVTQLKSLSLAGVTGSTSSGAADPGASDPWARGVLDHSETASAARGDGASAARGDAVVADAGRNLARRLREGPVTLDRFELVCELGVGSFGYVFRAWDPRLERVVALKVQRAGSFASTDEVQRFLREARSAAALKHPAIVSLHERGKLKMALANLPMSSSTGDARRL